MEITYFIDFENKEHVIIDRGNNEFTSMPKAIYDEQLAAQSANEL
jgi:hypothetical protein